MAAPVTCTISGAVYLAGAGQGGALVRWRVVPSTLPATAGDGYASAEPTTIYTDPTGAWSIAAPQGLTIWLEIPAVEVDHVLVVPSAATATLTNLSLVRVVR